MGRCLKLHRFNMCKYIPIKKMNICGKYAKNPVNRMPSRALQSYVKSNDPNASGGGTSLLLQANTLYVMNSASAQEITIGKDEIVECDFSFFVATDASQPSSRYFIVTLTRNGVAVAAKSFQSESVGSYDYGFVMGEFYDQPAHGTHTYNFTLETSNAAEYIYSSQMEYRKIKYNDSKYFIDSSNWGTV